jgi:hypothetical protein
MADGERRRPAVEDGHAGRQSHRRTGQTKLILKSLLDKNSNLPGSAVMPLVRTHASIVAGSAPNAAMTFTQVAPGA